MLVACKRNLSGFPDRVVESTRTTAAGIPRHFGQRRVSLGISEGLVLKLVHSGKARIDECVSAAF